MAVLMALATEAPRPPIELNPDIPPELNDLILRLLAKKPDGRFDSAAAVAEAIRAIEEARVAPTLRGGEPVAEGDRLAPPSRSAGSTARPRSPLVAAAAAAAALVLATIVVIVRDKDGRETARLEVPDDSSVTVSSGRVRATRGNAASPNVKPNAPAASTSRTCDEVGGGMATAPRATD